MSPLILIGLAIIAVIVYLLIYGVPESLRSSSAAYRPGYGRGRKSHEVSEPTSGTTSTQAAPPVIQKSDLGSNSDGLVPGAQAYDQLANQVFVEDLETMINRRMGEESKRLIPEPLAGDQFRWTGNYDPAKNDPNLASAMYRKSLNAGANDGPSLWKDQTKYTMLA